MQRRGNLLVAVFCIALGGFLVLLAGGFIADDPGKRHAPDFVIGLSGLSLVIAGCMVLVGRKSRFNDLLAGILCLSFGVIGAWVAFYAPSEGFSGGIPLVSSETNIMIGRWVFGIGSLVCFAISGWAFKRFYRSTR